MDDLEKRHRLSILRGIASQKTDNCLNINTLGNYLEDKLTKGEAKKAELHIQGCLYCLNRLADLRELMHLETHAEPLSQHLTDKLNKLRSRTDTSSIPSIPSTSGKVEAGIRDWITMLFGTMNRRYAWSTGLALVIACTLTAALILQWIRRGNPQVLSPGIEQQVRNAAVKIDVIGPQGSTIREASGFAVGENGLIVVSSNDIAGAKSARLRFSDGSSFQVEDAQAERGLACFRVNKPNLTALKLTQAGQPKIGDKVVSITDPADPASGVSDAIITGDLSPPRPKSTQKGPYVELVTTTTQNKKGILLNAAGEVVGMVISQIEDKNIAVRLNDPASCLTAASYEPIASIDTRPFLGEALSLYTKGEMAYDAKQYDSAVDYLKSAINRDPSLVAAHILLGSVYSEQKKNDLAVEEYREALRINPANIDARYYLAGQEDQAGLYDEAIKEYETILRYDPKDTDTLYELGISYLITGQKTKAAEKYEMLKFLDPGDAGKLRKLIELASKPPNG